MKQGTMAKRFELIVFDWDGTLMDSTGAIVASIQAAAPTWASSRRRMNGRGTSSASA
jgi:phosphoglycolate phosphatase-like HAD superfamily hydrolase